MKVYTKTHLLDIERHKETTSTLLSMKAKQIQIKFSFNCFFSQFVIFSGTANVSMINHSVSKHESSTYNTQQNIHINTCASPSRFRIYSPWQQLDVRLNGKRETSLLCFNRPRCSRNILRQEVLLLTTVDKSVGSIETLGGWSQPTHSCPFACQFLIERGTNSLRQANATVLQ